MILKQSVFMLYKKVALGLDLIIIHCKTSTLKRRARGESTNLAHTLAKIKREHEGLVLSSLGG